MEIKTQAALDKALKKDPGEALRLVGKVAFVVSLSGHAFSPSIVVTGGAQLNVNRAEGPRVYIEARENSTVTARENSTVTARENSTVTAWGYAFVRAFGAKKVEATPGCIVALHGKPDADGKMKGVVGGQQIVCPAPETPEAWCDHYGLPVKDGVVVLYKGVNAEYRSGWGGDYTPGTTPRLKTFKAEPECAAGALYFSPSPTHTLAFARDAAKFLACPVQVSEIVVHPYGSYPEKVKAIGCCGPVYEVDIHGKALPAREVA